MAMKPSSKFERMKLKPSDKMKPPASVKKPQMRGGVASSNAVMDRRNANPMAAARRKAMQKMAGGYGK
jgi:hypothetical protein